MLVCGCGKPARSSVQGKITLAGIPVDGGQIRLIPAEPGGVAAFGTIVAGEYHIPVATGPTAGKYRVEIQWQQKTGKKLEVPPNRVVEETRDVIPPAYNKESKLTVDIKPPSSDFSIDAKKLGN